MLLADVDIARSVQRALDEFFQFLPALLGALLILVIGYVVARLIGAALARGLQRAGVDETLTRGRSGEWIRKATSTPSAVLGRIAYWAVFLGAIALAVSALGIEALTSFMGAVFAYLPNVIAAFLIFVVAGAIAAGVGALASRTMGDTPTGKVVGTVVPGVVMAIAVFMILNQLRIAPEIVTITYAALIGSLALAAALAFGLGGREVAADMLRGAYVKGQLQKEQVKQDLAVGKERARTDIERARDSIESDDRPDRVSTTGAYRVDGPAATR